MTQEIALTLSLPPQRGARVGLFTVGDQGSYYNASNAPKDLPHQ
jgi:hypothetical protein